jgi:hypothetical protein
MGIAIAIVALVLLITVNVVMRHQRPRGETNLLPTFRSRGTAVQNFSTPCLRAPRFSSRLGRDVSRRRAILAAVATVVIALVSAPAGVSATRGGADGRIAFDRGGDIWAIDAPGSIPDPTRVQLTSGPHADAKPSWSPPIEFAERPALIAFQRTDSESGNTDIYSLDVDAGGAPVRLTDADAPDTAPAWAPDVLPGTPGEFDDPPLYPAIAFERVVGRNRDILVMNADGSGEVNVTNTPAIDESNPDWAPGGVVWSESLSGPHLAFDTAERGIREVFVMPITVNATAGFVTGPRRPVTTQQPPSSDPSWFAFTPPGDASPVGELTDQIAFSGPEDLVGVAQINIAEYARADPAVTDPNVFNSTPPFSQPGRIFTDVFSSGATSSTAPAWSPTGTRIAFVRDGEIYVLDPAADTDTATNVTQSPDVHEDHPDWEAPVARIDETFPRRPRGRRSRQRPARATSVVPTPKPQPPTPKPQPSTPPPGQCTMKGTPRADLLRGTRRRDVICAGAGRDVISGLTGNDVLRGGPGDDIIFGLAGNDDLLGGPGNDRLLGGRGKDRLGGGAGNDRIFGGPGRDRIAGGRGRDTLTGPRGRDRVTSVERPRRA